MTFEEFEAAAMQDARVFMALYEQQSFVEDPPAGGHCKLDRGLFICRFCGRSKADGATFESRAHIVPEALGNRTMVSHSECDTCNAYFADQDAHLSRFLGVNAVVSGVEGKARGKGKGRIRDHVNPATGLTVSRDTSEDHIRMDLTIELDKLGYDGDKKLLSVPVNTQPYSPLKAWKAVMKIGLAVCDYGEIGNFSRLNYTVRNEDEDDSLNGSGLLWVRTVDLPGPPVPIGPVSVTLYKAKDLGQDELLVPSKVVRILTGRTLIQSYMYSDENLARMERSPAPTGCFVPAVALISREDFEAFGPPVEGIHDMSSAGERVDIRNLTFRYTTPPVNIGPTDAS